MTDDAAGESPAEAPEATEDPSSDLEEVDEDIADILAEAGEHAENGEA